METVQINRCVHCMADVSAGAVLCPRCGKNPLTVDQPAYCLRPFSILRGKYLVGRMLGRGGFGITYVGWDMALEAKIAIKECYPSTLAVRDSSVSNLLQWDTSLAHDGQWRASCESFLREARKMAKVRGVPEVVRVQDTFEENNTAYIVMDFVEGITLKQWLEQNGILPPVRCVELLRPLMNALSRIHRQGIIHRDISPDNIMLETDGGLKLLDLGAAKELTPQHSHHSLLVTKSGFSPVEQYLESGKIGPWTDVYAMCATLYYCMTGKTVPPALDRLDDPSPLQFRPEDFKEPLPETVEAALRAGLAIRAAERTQSVDELLRQLGDGAAPGPAPASVTEDIPPTQPAPKPEPASKPEPEPKPEPQTELKPKSKGKLIAAAAAAVLVLLVLTGIGWMTNQNTGYDPTAPSLSLEQTVRPTLTAGDLHTVGLKADGTVVAVGLNGYGQCDVDGWTDIVAIAAGGTHTVGLRSDGTVVAVGMNKYNYFGECDVDGWTDIVAIVAGAKHTVGLKADSTVVAVGLNDDGECDVDGWTDIVAVAAGDFCTVGLKSDGTMVAAGWNGDGRCDVGDWADIVAIAMGDSHTVGLKSDGAVVAAGPNLYGECDVVGWTDIVAVAAGNAHTVGVKADGTVVATGKNFYGGCDVDGWTDIVAVAAGSSLTLGLKSDGTVVATGDNTYGQCGVDDWTGIVLP